MPRDYLETHDRGEEIANRRHPSMPPPPAMPPSSIPRRPTQPPWIHPLESAPKARYQEGLEDHEQHFYTERHGPMGPSGSRTAPAHHQGSERDSFHLRHHAREPPYPSETVHQMTYYRRSYHRPFPPDAPPPPPPRPMWKATLDSKSGKVYYYHRQSRQVSWKRPDEPVEDLPSSSVPTRTRHHGRNHPAEASTSQHQEYARSQAKKAAAVAAERHALKIARQQAGRAKDALQKAERAAAAKRNHESSRSRTAESHRKTEVPQIKKAIGTKRVSKTNMAATKSQPASKTRRIDDSASEETEDRRMTESHGRKRALAKNIADLQRKRKGTAAKKPSSRSIEPAKRSTKRKAPASSTNRPSSSLETTWQQSRVITQDDQHKRTSTRLAHQSIDPSKPDAVGYETHATTSQKQVYSTSRLASNLKLARFQETRRSDPSRLDESVKRDVIDLTMVESPAGTSQSLVMEEAQRAWEYDNLILAAIKKEPPPNTGTTSPLGSDKFDVSSRHPPSPRPREADERPRLQSDEKDSDATRTTERMKPLRVSLHSPPIDNDTEKKKFIAAQETALKSDKDPPSVEGRGGNYEGRATMVDSNLCPEDSEAEIPILDSKGLLTSLQAADPYFLVHQIQSSDKTQHHSASRQPQKRRRVTRQLPMVRPKLLSQSSTRKAAVRNFQFREVDNKEFKSKRLNPDRVTASARSSDQRSKKISPNSQKPTTDSIEEEAPRRRKSRAAAERAKAALACYTIATSSESENDFEAEIPDSNRKHKAVSRKTIVGKDRLMERLSAEVSEYIRANEELLAILAEENASEIDSENEGLRGLLDLVRRGGEFKISQLVVQTTSMLEDAIRLFPWTWPQSDEDHADLVSNAFQQFSRDVIVPTMCAHNNREVTNAVPVILGTLLFLREVMMQNAEAIFGPSILPPSEGISRREDRTKEFIDSVTIFSIKTLVTSVLLFALDKFGGGFLSDRFLMVVDSYDTGKEEFSSLMEQIQDAKYVSLPGGKMMEAGESKMWQASQNHGLLTHPVREEHHKKEEVKGPKPDMKLPSVNGVHLTMMLESTQQAE